MIFSPLEAMTSSKICYGIRDAICVRSHRIASLAIPRRRLFVSGQGGSPPPGEDAVDFARTPSSRHVTAVAERQPKTAVRSGGRLRCPLRDHRLAAAVQQYCTGHRICNSSLC